MKASVANAIVLSLALTGAVMAQDTFEVNITGDMTVAPGGTADFTITGEFTSTTPENMGLAFFSIDLEVVGPQDVVLGTALVMNTGGDVASFFAPLGYSIDDTGTVVGNNLVQAGGGQNTINNDPDAEPFEPFPSGAVVEDLGTSGPITLFDGGTLTLADSLADEVYTLRVIPGSLHANAITGFDGSFYSVDAVNVVIGSELVVTVDDVCNPPRILAAGEPNSVTVPCSGFIDPRQEPGALTELVISFNEGVRSVGGAALSAADFSATTSSGAARTVTGITVLDSDADGALSVRVTLDQPIPLQHWTTIIANVENSCGAAITNAGDLGPGVDEDDRVDIAFLPGDIDQNGITNPIDLFSLRNIIVNGVLPAGVCDGITAEDLADTNRSGDVAPIDLFTYRQLINGVAPAASMPWGSVSLLETRP